MKKFRKLFSFKKLRYLIFILVSLNVLIFFILFGIRYKNSKKRIEKFKQNSIRNKFYEFKLGEENITANKTLIRETVNRFCLFPNFEVYEEKKKNCEKEKLNGEKSPICGFIFKTEKELLNNNIEYCSLNEQEKKKYTFKFQKILIYVHIFQIQRYEIIKKTYFKDFQQLKPYFQQLNLSVSFFFYTIHPGNNIPQIYNLKTPCNIEKTEGIDVDDMHNCEIYTMKNVLKFLYYSFPNFDFYYRSDDDNYLLAKGVIDLFRTFPIVEYPTIIGRFVSYKHCPIVLRGGSGIFFNFHALKAQIELIKDRMFQSNRFVTCKHAIHDDVWFGKYKYFY